jgi:signal transduction histidine kinase
VGLGAGAARAAEIARAHAARHGTDKTTRILVAPTAAPADVDVYEVTSAIVNLIVNAIDAIGAAGGTITVRAGGDAAASWVEVDDDGPGIADDVRARMFEPFYSTKGEHRSGLGLGMVAACMRRHGGTVTVDSTAGAGSRFRLTFPS